MKKKKPVAMIAATLVLLLVAGALFVACNKDVGVGSMGVEPYPDKFTNDLDTVDAENLAAGADTSASSETETAANVLDGDTATAWTAENTSGQFLEITFSEPVSFNTVVLRENGNYISGFGFVLPDEDGNYPADMKSSSFYRQQDRIERYRYCTFERQTDVTEFRIWFGGTDAGKALSIAEAEVYDVTEKEQDFRVFNYYTPQDLQYMETADLLDDFRHDTITDVILISFAFWDENGGIVYAEDPKNYDTSDPDYDRETDQFRFVGEHPDPDGYYDEAIDKVRAAVDGYAEESGRKINICIDFYPKDTSKHGLPANETALVQSIKQLIADDDRVDGIDIDWEYPTSAYEWKVYGDMLVEARKMLDASGKDKYISLALSAGSVTLTQEHIDAVDFVQMMAYDRFDIVDGNHSSFRSGAYSSMRYFVNIGFKPSQLVLGLPLYGRPTSWDTVWTNYGYGDTVYSTQGKDPYTYWDNIQWLYYDGTNLDGSIEYDNEFMQVWVNGAALVADKTAYVIEQGFAGVMLWRESTDYAWDATDENGMPLSVLRAIYDTACERIVGYGE